ncbi:MAG: DUF4386 domain-containing protein [Flavobacterium sp.]|uniref:DUF4386 domain-containing protein n=1 Tax=Flavobacterium sp. TaxID=239 RepID=UPI0012076346|nr:DUF4386 domain-containing protein [Flavobacterium sp.]RZJ66449.1 MAG: DUF4386 domain-containing protein [Flavobacterium sp.]
MEPTKKTARISGLIYLVVVLSGMFSLLYVPGQLIDWNDVSATFHNMQQNQSLYRFGILSSVICYVAFIFLALSLYKLLRSVNESEAKLMAILAIVSVPISFANLQNSFTVLSLVSHEPYLKTFTNVELQNQLMFHLDKYDHGIMAVSVFWGLWLFPFGHLIFKSGFLPKFLGVFLMLGCAGYLINFIGRTAIPGYSESGFAGFVSLPSAVGEIGICFWLLIVGVRIRKTSVR